MSAGRNALRLATTLAVGAGGGLAAALIGLPLPWLLGSALSVAVASLSGVRLHLPNWLRDISFFILGILAGSGVTPEVLDQMALWPLSFLIQLVGVAGVIWLTMLFLQHALGWDRETAFFASLPGALAFVLATASETKADMTRIVIVQSFRLLALLLVLTPTLAWMQEGDGLAAGSARLNGTPLQYAIFLVSCITCAWLAHRAKLPGGIILGALLGSALMHAGEIAPVAIPVFVAVPGLVILGAFVGARLRHEDRHAMAGLLPASIGAFVVGMAVCAAAGVVAHYWLGIDYGRLALAYAPGAIEALTVIAYQFDVDPAYVAAHHVVRFLALALSIPLLARWLAGGPKRAPAVPEE